LNKPWEYVIFLVFIYIQINKDLLNCLSDRLHHTGLDDDEINPWKIFSSRFLSARGLNP